MVLGPRLDLRQGQSLVMTPQLQQAIRLLALPNIEVADFIAEAANANPLLELGEPEAPDDPGRSRPTEPARSAVGDQWRGSQDAASAGAGSRRDDGWSDEGARLDPAEAPLTLAEHLHRQLGTVRVEPPLLEAARAIVGQLDDAGYLPSSLAEVAEGLAAPLAVVEAALTLVQGLDPTGVGARSLGECLALQAREADRYDPCMARLLDNLDLVAKGAIAQLKRRCAVDEEDLADMLDELRGYDPKPGLRFGQTTVAVVRPDILVRAAPDGGWDIALNPATLPRLLVDRSYYLQLRRGCTSAEARAWLGDKLAEANWLVKALDQRARTIVKVASEIVRQQQGFFEQGVSQLRPLTLARVAEAIEMHESTVSRVTSNKYLACDRGMFELKYFFGSGVASEGGEGAAAEAVKAAIRDIIDGEDEVLSDDAIAAMLKDKGIDVARRTVVKYREAMGIGSSIQRRRQRKMVAG